MIEYRTSNDDIDLIAVNSEGVIGSYAVCQIDPVTKIGEFDPLGTRTRYRRRGLAAAVINEGLRAMRGKGMEIAVVRTQADAVPAVKLYESVGFEIADKLYTYVKPKPNC